MKQTSPEVKCLHPTSSRREMCTLSVSNMIYHNFSHGATFYMLNGKNVNVMLEFSLFIFILCTIIYLAILWEDFPLENDSRYLNQSYKILLFDAFSLSK